MPAPLTSLSRRRCAVLIALLIALAGAMINTAPAEAAQADFASVDAGDSSTCALKPTTAVAYCWGKNDRGQSSPPWGWTFKQIAVGSFMACGLGGDAVVTCWGVNPRGSTPGRGQWQIPGRYLQIDLGDRHFCGILQQDNSISCWGQNFYGEAPASVPGQFVGLSTGGVHSCGLRSDLTITCWGHNGNGQIKVPKTSDRYLQVVAGGSHTCALKTNLDAACWGNNASSWFSLPGQAPPLVKGPFTSLAAGGAHTCAIQRSNSGLYCWGGRAPVDNDGQSEPPYTGKYTQISAGSRHSCALRTDKVLVCWGDNSSGQLP